VIGAGCQPSVRDRRSNQAGKTWFDNRANSLAEELDLGGVRIDTYYIMSVAGQAGGGDCPDITQAEHCYFHSSVLMLPGVALGAPNRIDAR
jgi:hypothetical protein